MIDIIRGASEKPASTEALISFLEQCNIPEGILYTGYPIVGSINDKSSMDAILLSSNHGIIVFDIVEEPEVSDREELLDELYNITLQRLIGHRELTRKRGELKANLNVLTFAPAWNSLTFDESRIITLEDLQTFLKENEQDDLTIDDYRKLIQAIQAITKLKHKVPRKVKKVGSKGDILNEVEKSISNLDKRQSKAVIETVEGIQRIRGLAGSGKTIILALKVAYLHSKFPDWTIGVTFYTRSLKSQFVDLINKFTIAQKNEEPDWNKVKILQAWGGSSDSGLYFEFCKLNNVEYLDYDTAKRRYNTSNELLDIITKKAIQEAQAVKQNLTEVYDAILIDEAQDFSESFLMLCYLLTKPASQSNPNNKRVIYAYDELQKLNEANSLRNPREIFPGIDFESYNPNKPQQDIILEKCYRNSAPILVTAHALGFGIYRENGELVTMFREKELWKDVGYKIEKGDLELGQRVVLGRDKESSPDFLVEKVNQDELIQFRVFDSYEEEIKQVAEDIEKNIREEDLDPRDIIVIHPNALRTKNDVAALRKELFKRNIESHLAGVNTSQDEFFISDSVAFTSIYRAKGNEAAMVYIINADYCYKGYNLTKKRNILFTAITRSKGWVRVYGSGEDMKGLEEEFKKVKVNKYKLSFKYPTEEEMERLNILHRDLTEEDIKVITESNREGKNLLNKLKSGKLQKEDLNKDLLEQLRNYLNDPK